MTTLTRSQEVAAVLRTEILRRQYRVGERLPSERDLAARFETNRGAIREALKQLEQLGIIEIQPGGARVVPTEEATLEVLGYLLNLDGQPNPKLIDDYLLVFKMFCVMSAENSVTNATAEQRLFISSVIAKMRKDPSDRELMREGWTELFTYFLTINDNLVMHLISNGLKAQLLAQVTDLDPAGDLDEKKIAKILSAMNKAVKNEDAKLMGECVGQYFDWVRETIAIALSNLNITLSKQAAFGS